MTDDALPETPAIFVCGGGSIDPAAVTVWDEALQANVCGLCGSDSIHACYGLGGGGGIGAYNFCNGCLRILDKSSYPEME